MYVYMNEGPEIVKKKKSYKKALMSFLPLYLLDEEIF